MEVELAHQELSLAIVPVVPIDKAPISSIMMRSSEGIPARSQELTTLRGDDPPEKSPNQAKDDGLTIELPLINPFHKLAELQADDNGDVIEQAESITQSPKEKDTSQSDHSRKIQVRRGRKPKK